MKTHLTIVAYRLCNSFEKASYTVDGEGILNKKANNFLKYFDENSMQSRKKFFNFAIN